jgi:predicted CoA-binding protein
LPFLDCPKNKKFLTMKKTIVLGASPNPARYAYHAVRQLIMNDLVAIPVGVKAGNIEGINIETTPPQYSDIHTISIYINPDLQAQYHDYVLGLKPQRVIFNPGTENPRFAAELRAEGIETINACTLVMLSIGNY